LVALEWAAPPFVGLDAELWHVRGVPRVSTSALISARRRSALHGLVLILRLAIFAVAAS